MNQKPKLVESVYSEPYYVEDPKTLAQLYVRLDNQSLQIKALRIKITQILSNHRYYIQKRLPKVLEREKIKQKFNKTYIHATQVLKAFTDKDRISFISRSKDPKKKEKRYIGLFTNGEMYKLRLFLADKRDRKFKEKKVEVLP